jgi:uncharacterized membrane protein
MTMEVPTMRGATTAKRVLDVLAGADRGQGVDARALLTVVPGDAADVASVIDGLVSSGCILRGSVADDRPGGGRILRITGEGLAALRSM